MTIILLWGSIYVKYYYCYKSYIITQYYYRSGRTHDLRTLGDCLLADGENNRSGAQTQSRPRRWPSTIPGRLHRDQVDQRCSPPAGLTTLVYGRNKKKKKNVITVIIINNVFHYDVERGGDYRSRAKHFPSDVVFRSPAVINRSPVSRRSQKVVPGTDPMVYY